MLVKLKNRYRNGEGNQIYIDNRENKRYENEKIGYLTAHIYPYAEFNELTLGAEYFFLFLSWMIGVKDL